MLTRCGSFLAETVQRDADLLRQHYTRYRDNVNVPRSWWPRYTLGRDCPSLAARSVFYNFQLRPSSPQVPVVDRAANERTYPRGDPRILRDTKEDTTSGSFLHVALRKSGDLIAVTVTVSKLR